jgi:hypothetical protein
LLYWAIAPEVLKDTVDMHELGSKMIRSLQVWVPYTHVRVEFAHDGVGTGTTVMVPEVAVLEQLFTVAVNV